MVMRLLIISIYFLLISAMPALLGGDISLLSKLVIIVTGMLLMFICAGVYKSLAGKIFTVLISALWALNLSVSFFFYQKHDIRFSSSIAETFINTNSSETVGMLSYNKYYILFYIIVFAVYFISIHKSAKYLNRKTTWASLGLFFGYLVVIPAHSAALLPKSGSYLLLAEQYLSHTPFYNASALVRNLYENREITKIPNTVVQYQYDKKEASSDIYVLIIGESVRRDHLSLYGYQYETTPNLDQRKPQMLVFDQAYSPAPVTILSVPISLSNISFSQMQDKQHYADNIVALANHAGFETYWISNQGKTNRKTSIISTIASMAKHRKWNEFVGYDEEILGYFNNAINDGVKKKKLIVLHTYGSHEPSCNRFPEEKYQEFSTQEDDNCYDSSIAYTDALIENILQQLSGKSATVMYFSDHALQRLDDKYDVYYHHGVNNPTKEAYEIPLFVWYSPNSAKPSLDNTALNAPYSTANNYWLISDWLGIQQHSPKACLSPLNSCYQAQKEITMIDGNRTLLSLKNLPSEQGAND